MSVWILRHLSCINPFTKILSRSALFLGHPDPCKSSFYCLVCRMDFHSGKLTVTYFIKYSDQNLLVFLEKSESHINFPVVSMGRTSTTMHGVRQNLFHFCCISWDIHKHTECYGFMRSFQEVLHTRCTIWILLCLLIDTKIYELQMLSSIGTHVHF